VKTGGFKFFVLHRRDSGGFADIEARPSIVDLQWRARVKDKEKRGRLGTPYKIEKMSGFFTYPSPSYPASMQR